jgi:hypothetical protein
MTGRRRAAGTQRQDMPVAHAQFLFGNPLLLKHAPFANGVDWGAPLPASIFPEIGPGPGHRDHVSDEDSFERALGLAAPIVDSNEFHAP